MSELGECIVTCCESRIFVCMRQGETLKGYPRLQRSKQRLPAKANALRDSSLRLWVIRRTFNVRALHFLN